MLLENLRFYAEEEGKPRGLAEDATKEEKDAAKKALKEGPQKELSLIHISGACVAALSGLFPVAGAGSDGSGAAGLSGCSARKGPIPGHKKTPHGAEYQANNC